MWVEGRQEADRGHNKLALSRRNPAIKSISQERERLVQRDRQMLFHCRSFRYHSTHAATTLTWHRKITQTRQEWSVDP
jgi:hypothetical protein